MPRRIHSSREQFFRSANVLIVAFVLLMLALGAVTHAVAKPLGDFIDSIPARYTNAP